MSDLKLTKRQLQVLQLRADGLHRMEIAERLGLDVETVDTHQYRAIKKLGTRNCAQAMLVLGRMGLLGEVTR